MYRPWSPSRVSLQENRFAHQLVKIPSPRTSHLVNARRYTAAKIRLANSKRDDVGKKHAFLHVQRDCSSSLSQLQPNCCLYMQFQWNTVDEGGAVRGIRCEAHVVRFESDRILGLPHILCLSVAFLPVEVSLSQGRMSTRRKRNARRQVASRRYLLSYSLNSAMCDVNASRYMRLFVLLQSVDVIEEWCKNA